MLQVVASIIIWKLWVRRGRNEMVYNMSEHIGFACGRSLRILLTGK